MRSCLFRIRSHSGDRRSWVGGACFTGASAAHAAGIGLGAVVGGHRPAVVGIAAAAIQSSIPFPLQVRSSVPPLTVRSPLESRQSPSDTTVMVPPLTVIKLSSWAEKLLSPAAETGAVRPRRR